MVKTESGKRFLLVFALSLWGACYAQDLSKKTLRDVLDQLEERFSVRFSYMDQAIDSIYVDISVDELSLEQSLQYLEQKARLQFVMLDDNYISIKVTKSDIKICGYLFDEDNGASISDALIYAQADFTNSDFNGYFELPTNTDSRNVQIKHVSYQDQTISHDWSSAECPQFYLTPLVNMLDEIVIQNYITRGIDKLANGETSMDVQHTNILPGLTEPDVFFVLQNLPGIHSIYETVTDINIRGGSNDQNLILWDGLRLYQVGHFFGLISAINPYTVGKANLLKNGTPARLGEGVSGTIMLQTRGKDVNKITAQAGSNLINSNVLVDVPINKIHILVASRQSIGGLFNTPTYGQYFDRAFRFSDVINDPNSQVIKSDEKFRFYDLSLNATYTPSSTASIKGGTLVLDNSIEYEESALIGNEVVSKSSNLDQRTFAGYLSYDQRWSEHFKTKLYSSVMNYTQESVNFDVLTGQEHALENEVLESTVKLDGSYYLNETWNFEGGFQLVETGIRNFRDINLPEFRSLSKEVLRTTILFAESHASLTSNTNLTLGIRSSFFDKLNKIRIEPRLTLLTRLGGPFFLEALAESKSQTTVQVVDFQTDFLGVENRKWELVNAESIPLLTSNQASVSLNYQKPSLLVSIEGFLKEVDGVVTSSQGFLNQFQHVKTSGSYGASGFELLINPSFGSLDSWITYAYLKSDYSFSDLTPDNFRTNYDISHTLSLGLSYRLNGLELSAGLNYRNGKPYTLPIGIDRSTDEIVFDTPNSVTLDPYFRVDFSAKYTFKFSEKISGNCGLAIWNLTNRGNVINTFSSISEEGIVSQVNQNALGITPNLNLNFVYTP